MEPIEEEAKKLEALNEQRSGMVHRLKMTEKDRDALEDSKVEAETYIAKEQELLKWRGVLCQLFLTQTAANLGSIDQSKEELEQRLQHEKAKFAEYATQLEATESSYSTCLREHTGIAAELERSNKQFKEFERKDIEYREDLKHAKTKVKKAEQQRAQAEAKLQAGAQQVRARVCVCLRVCGPALPAHRPNPP